MAFGLDQKSLLGRQLKVEALVATCMKKQGFDYVPMEPSTVVVGQGKFVVSGLNADEFRKLYGYGISTTYDTTASGGKAASPNPNATIRDGLSANDQKAYDRALNGGSVAGTFADAVVQGDFSKLAGCNKSATAEVFGGAEALGVVQSVLDELDKRVTADPQMAQAERAWADCLGAAGFKYATSDQIDQSLRQRLDATVGTSGGAGYDRAALSALQQEELRIADVDWACETKFKQPVEPKVIAAVEKAYFDAHPELATKVRG
jgi:hypothetical protein